MKLKLLGLLWLAASAAVASPGLRPPALSVDLTALTFNAPVGGPNPAPQAVTITNAGTGQMDWSAADVETWLSQIPASGRLGPSKSEAMDVFVDVTGLAAGTYNDTITVTAPGSSGSPATIDITLNVSASPVIGLSTNTLVFNAPVGGPNPPLQVVTVSNSGGGTLAWNASDVETWVSESPVSGNLSAGASEPMSVSIDVTGLAAGNYMDTITVSDASASNSPQTINVSLTVSATPNIGLNPTSLTFNAPEGGPNPVAQVVTVSNSGGGTLNWTAMDVETWLSETPASGSLSAGASEPTSVAVDVTGLVAGTYMDTITVSDASAGNSPQVVLVTLNVTALPTIDLSPTSLTFNAPVGGPNPSSQDVTVSNVGGGTLNWSATDSETWLSVSPGSGSVLSGGSETMTASADVTGLVAGTYTGTITVSDAGAGNSPQAVFVTLNVIAVPTIALNPTSLTFDAPVGGPNPATQDVTVSNVGGGTLNWSAVDSETWLSVGPASGALASGGSEPMTVTVDVTGLVAGTYAGTITVSDGGASNSPQIVSVTLNLSSLPRIGLNPTSLTFSMTQGGANPSPQAVSITNSGSGTLDWSVLDDGPWVSESPGSGSLGAVQSEPMTVSISGGGLTAGVYSATITVSDAGAANSPQIVSVTLTVNPRPPKNTVKAGQCGSSGLELLIPPLLAWVWRRRRRKGGRS